MTRPSHALHRLVITLVAATRARRWRGRGGTTGTVDPRPRTEKAGKMAIREAVMKTIRTLLWVGLLALGVIGLATHTVEAREELRGEIALLAYDFCPAGWLPTDGRTLPIHDYMPLFQAVGTKYG